MRIYLLAKLSFGKFGYEEFESSIELNEDSIQAIKLCFGVTVCSEEQFKAGKKHLTEQGMPRLRELLQKCVDLGTLSRAMNDELGRWLSDDVLLRSLMERIASQRIYRPDENDSGAVDIEVDDASLEVELLFNPKKFG